jgi:hypothetical protein
MRTSARARWAQMGAVTTVGTVAAGILCCLPFATGVFGATLAAVGARFEPWRPYLTAISVGLLACAFFLSYRRNATTCETGACDTAPNARTRRLVVWLVAIVVIVLLTAPGLDELGDLLDPVMEV